MDLLLGDNVTILDLFLNWQVWAIVVALSLLTLISSVAKYRLGKSGLPAVKEQFPQISEDRWERLDNYFNRWGAFVVLFSFLPVLAMVIPPVAGAYGVRFGLFLVFAFLAKLIRYWILVLLLFLGYQIIAS